MRGTGKNNIKKAWNLFLEKLMRATKYKKIVEKLMTLLFRKKLNAPAHLKHRKNIVAFRGQTHEHDFALIIKPTI